MTISHAPSYGKAKEAARKIFGIIEEPSTINAKSSKGIEVVQRGEIEFREVDFRYPSRQQRVLRSINFKIAA